MNILLKCISIFYQGGKKVKHMNKLLTNINNKLLCIKLNTIIYGKIEYVSQQKRVAFGSRGRVN